jgi:PAS domain S-box-containing protein
MTRTKARELLISSVVAVVGLLAAARFDVFERFEGWVRRSRVVAFVRDIGGRRRAADKLGEAETRYRALVEQVPGIIYVRDVAGSGRRSPAVYTSPQIEAQTGYPPQAFIEDPELWIGLLHPDDRERVLAEDRRTDETGEPFRIEYRQICRDGRVVWVRDEAFLVRDEEGNPSYWQGIQLDITERKQAEEALRESEERYRLVAQATNEVIWDNDLTTGKQIWDGAIEAMFGYRPEEVGEYADWWEERIHPEDRERVVSGTEAVLVEDGGETWSDEYRFRRADGSYSTVADRASVVRDEKGEPVRMIGSMMDVTERRRAEEQVRASEAELRALFEAMSDVILVLDSEGRYLEIAPTNPSLLYKPSEDLIGKTLHEVFPREQADEFFGCIRRALESRRAVNMEYRLRIGEREVWFAGTVSPMLEDRVVFVARDITEYKQAEEALREAEELFRSAFDDAPIGVAVNSLDGRYLRVNRALCDILGYPEDELRATTFQNLTYPEDYEVSMTYVNRLLAGEVDKYSLEKRYVRADGRPVWVSMSASLVRDPDDRPLYYVAQIQEITERKRAEERLREANRRLEELAALRRDFTAMVAHEIGSPLASVRGFLDVLATGELGPEEQADVLVKIRTEIDRLNTLVADVRTAATVEHDDFALMPRPTAVDELLEDAARFAETLPGDHPFIIKAEANGRVWADPYRIGQVLRNLLSNAAKYSPDGAPIELRATSGATPGRIRLEVVDSGRGVHPDDVDVIFEKFGRGRDRSGQEAYGVGLGLYLSRRILQAHGSDLTLDPAPKGGSVFFFELEAVA